ncbi:hypothetical protein ACKI1J_18350 [Streptomyces scabiei]|uniref:hypothetical protein n=1 Tax=Streptomyces scabiei TaxID=1930 RepID=UPI0038F5EDDE
MGASTSSARAAAAASISPPASAFPWGPVGLGTGLVLDPVAPFRGGKRSGPGHEGGRAGIDGFREYGYQYQCLAVPVG